MAVGNHPDRPCLLRQSSGIGCFEARRTPWGYRIGEFRSGPSIGKRQNLRSGAFRLAAGAEELNAATDGGVGGVDRNDLGGGGGVTLLITCGS